MCGLHGIPILLCISIPVFVSWRICLQLHLHIHNYCMHYLFNIGPFYRPRPELLDRTRPAIWCKESKMSALLILSSQPISSPSFPIFSNFFYPNRFSSYIANVVDIGMSLFTFLALRWHASENHIFSPRLHLQEISARSGSQTLHLYGCQREMIFGVSSVFSRDVTWNIFVYIETWFLTYFSC